MILNFQSSPERGGGPRPKGVVEGAQPQTIRAWWAPSTMLRIVPLPVPGRI